MGRRGGGSGGGGGGGGDHFARNAPSLPPALAKGKEEKTKEAERTNFLSIFRNKMRGGPGNHQLHSCGYEIPLPMSQLRFIVFPFVAKNSLLMNSMILS